VSPIPEIGIRDVSIQNVYVPRWMIRQPTTYHLLPPVVVNVGNPIINIPGCVTMHKDDKKHKKNIPIDKNLVENDSKGAMTVCPDGSYPSYDAMNYEPENLIIMRDQKPPVIPPPPDAPTPPTPDTSKTTVLEDVPCPAPNQPRIGDVAQNQKEKVSGYELQPDPNNPNKEICVILYEDINFVEQYLPAPQVVSTTAAIATVATTSALLAKPLADLLLKVVKPVVKKVIAKVNAILGKTSYRPTASEIRTNQYREKKGMLPLKFGQKKKPKKK
jgi:hypothetical protein